MSRVCLLLAMCVFVGTTLLGIHGPRAEDKILKLSADAWDSKEVWRGHQYKCRKPSCGGERSEILVLSDWLVHRSESEIRQSWFSVRALAFAAERYLEERGWDIDFQKVTKVVTADYAGFTATGRAKVGDQSGMFVLNCFFQEGSRFILVGAVAPTLDVARRNMGAAIRTGDLRRR